MFGRLPTGLPICATQFTKRLVDGEYRRMLFGVVQSQTKLRTFATAMLWL
jgi:hypothetical protein